MYKREFCKPDTTLNRRTWVTAWQKFQLVWLSQKKFSLRSKFFKLHLQHHFITTQAARNKYVNMQWIILHSIWAQRPINWKVFFKKVEPWFNWVLLFCSVATTEIQLIQGTEHQCSTCSITDLTLYNKENQTMRGPGVLVPRTVRKGPVPSRFMLPSWHYFQRGSPTLQALGEDVNVPKTNCHHFFWTHNAVNTVSSQNKFNAKIISIKWEHKACCWVSIYSVFLHPRDNFRFLLIKPLLWQSVEANPSCHIWAMKTLIVH